jgi:hypothetical protein
MPTITLTLVDVTDELSGQPGLEFKFESDPPVSERVGVADLSPAQILGAQLVQYLEMMLGQMAGPSPGAVYDADGRPVNGNQANIITVPGNRNNLPQ